MSEEDPDVLELFSSKVTARLKRFPADITLFDWLFK